MDDFYGISTRPYEINIILYYMLVTGTVSYLIRQIKQYYIFPLRLL